LVVVSERTRMVKYGTINYAWLRQSSWIAAEASVLAVKQRPLRASLAAIILDCPSMSKTLYLYSCVIWC
jgi:hypothetical protein